MHLGLVSIGACFSFAYLDEMFAHHDRSFMYACIGKCDCNCHKSFRTLLAMWTLKVMLISLRAILRPSML